MQGQVGCDVIDSLSVVLVVRYRWQCRPVFFVLSGLRPDAWFHVDLPGIITVTVIPVLGEGQPRNSSGCWSAVVPAARCSLGWKSKLGSDPSSRPAEKGKTGVERQYYPAQDSAIDEIRDRGGTEGGLSGQ